MEIYFIFHPPSNYANFNFCSKASLRVFSSASLGHVRICSSEQQIGHFFSISQRKKADNHYTRFSHDIFAFSSSTEVHLHCKIEVCLDTWCNTVQENCANLQSQGLQSLRKRRAIHGEVQKVTELVISASPAFTYDYQDPSLRFVNGRRNRYDGHVVREVLDSGSITADFLSVR